jgi:hypothetical protein
MRTRVRLLVQLTTRHGRYRRGLVQAARSLNPQEAAVLADLEAHGLDVNRLRDVLWGGHVLIDDPDLYERWRFPKVTRERLSSHHRTVDKQSYPDLGMHGPLVREKLHGRTANGTWIQLEKTPAAFGAGHRLPTWNDVQHLADYIVYKVTKRNVGPWGLSAVTERRPMYLSPQLSTTVPLPEGTTRALTGTLARLDAEDQVVHDATHSGLVRQFLGPLREHPLAELEPWRAADGVEDCSAGVGHRDRSGYRPTSALGGGPARRLDVARCGGRATRRGGGGRPAVAAGGSRSGECPEGVMTEPKLDVGVPSDLGVPPGLIDAVLHLVSTGPVPLGGYSLAEMVAVDAVVDFLDEMPSEEQVGEAVRSLAARQLLVALPGTDRLQVRGDLGIAVVFQQRARSVIDARVTGTEPGHPWRTLLLPPPEGVALEVLIDALGVHELSLREIDDALRRLRERLPNGEPEREAPHPKELLATAEGWSRSRSTPHRAVRRPPS